MKKYKLELELLSDTLIGSAEGYGATIDTDVTFDDFGLPYIPSKRVKGILRDSARELIEMFKLSGVDIIQEDDLDKIFGKIGSNEDSPFYISNLTLQDYELVKQNIEYFNINNKNELSSDRVIGTFTAIRRQTSMEENERKSKEHSLRTSRVVKAGNKFFGEIEFGEDKENIFALICHNTRRMGSKRNRGLGKIAVKIFDDKKELNQLGINLLEGKCKN